MTKAYKVATINDLSGYGRCSLTTAIPILSVIGVQCCPLPTAVLSRHTGFKDYYFKDLTEIIPEYSKNWIDNKIRFDAVFSGFLGSFDQIKLTEEFILSQKDSAICVVDTVMGDHGKAYQTYTKEMCSEMKRLVSIADVITPNVTEACILTDTEYIGNCISESFAKELCEKLYKMGCKTVIITGIEFEDKLCNFIYSENVCKAVYSKRCKTIFSGTGDMFASVVTGMLVKGEDIVKAVKMSADFIYGCLEFTVKQKTPIEDGVFFEPLLYKLGGIIYG